MALEGEGGGALESAKDLLAATSTLTPVANFFAGDVANRDGVRVAAKDLDGDYRADIVAGIGPTGATTTVRTFAGKSLPLAGAATPLAEFTVASADGVYVG